MHPMLVALDKAADGAYAIDETQRIVYWNGVAQKMLGYSAEEVMGRHCHEIVRGRDDHDHIWCRSNCYVTAASRAGEQVETFNTCARTKSGGLRWINVSILVLPAIDGSSSVIVHLFRDATGIKQQELFARQVLDLAQNLQQATRPEAPPLLQKSAANQLTQREIEVLALMAEGLSTDKIAEALSVSRSTTRNHIQNILQKLHVHNRSAAVAYAFEHSIISR